MPVARDRRHFIDDRSGETRKPDVAGSISDKRTLGKGNGRVRMGALEVLQQSSQQQPPSSAAPRGNDVAALCAQLEGLDADDDAGTSTTPPR